MCEGFCVHTHTPFTLCGFKKTKPGSFVYAFRILAFFDSIISYFFYLYTFFINIIFENCLNIRWMGILSVQVLQEADARRGLTVQGTCWEKSLWRTKEREQARQGDGASVTPVRGDQEEGFARESITALRRACLGWWGVSPWAEVAHRTVLTLDKNGLAPVPLPCLVNGGGGQQGGSVTATWTLMWIQRDGSRRLLVNSPPWNSLLKEIWTAPLPGHHRVP